MLVGCVRSEADRAIAELGDCFVDGLLLAPGQQHLRACVDQAARDREADAARAAGDDRTASGELLLACRQARPVELLAGLVSAEAEAVAELATVRSSATGRSSRLGSGAKSGVRFST